MKLSLTRVGDEEYLKIKYTPEEVAALKQLFENEMHLRKSHSDSAFGGSNSVDYYKESGTEMLTAARERITDPDRIEAVDAINSPVVVTNHGHDYGYATSKINISILRVIPDSNGEVKIKIGGRGSISKLDSGRLMPTLRNTFEALFQEEYELNVEIVRKRLLA